MTDQDKAVLVGFLLVFGLRLLDWFLPKGWVSRWTGRHGRPKDDDGDVSDLDDVIDPNDKA